MRGHYQNVLGRRMQVGVDAPRQYEKDLNQETDLLFWSETRYKPGQRLDPHDPADARMIPVWLRTRAHVAQTRTPQELRHNAAVAAAFDEHKRSGLPYYVYSRGSSAGEALIPFADQARAFSYARARLADSDYVAYFSTADSRWPSPAFESSPRSVT